MGTCRDRVYGSLLFLPLYPVVGVLGPILSDILLMFTQPAGPPRFDSLFVLLLRASSLIRVKVFGCVTTVASGGLWEAVCTRSGVNTTNAARGPLGRNEDEDVHGGRR